MGFALNPPIVAEIPLYAPRNMNVVSIPKRTGTMVALIIGFVGSGSGTEAVVINKEGEIGRTLLAEVIAFVKPEYKDLFAEYELTKQKP